MEKLWYTLSDDVLKEMIKFVPRSKDEDCPKFLLEIKKVTPAMGRYILNAIDGTNLELLCLTSAEYSKTFSAQIATTGTLIRILHYWLFKIECHTDNQNEEKFKYIIMILEAEIMKLPPAKSIVSITRITSKTPRVHGIVDIYSNTTCHGESPLRFRLRDRTGSIGCSASGAMYAPLHSILKEGVRVELSHAMVTKVHPEHVMSDKNFELKLNQFSVLKIYDSDNLKLLFTYSPQDIVEKLSDRRLKVNSSGISFNQSSVTSKLPEQSSSNNRISTQMSSSRPHSSKQSSSTLLNLRENYISFQPKFRPASKLMNTPFRLSSSQPCSGQSGSNQKFDLNLYQQKLLLEQNISNSIPRTKSCELESNESNPITEPSVPQRKSPPPPKSLNILPRFIQRNCFNGKTPVPIDSLTQPGICRSWIRGIVERYSRLNTVDTRFYLRDQSTAIRCTVLEPASSYLNKILKDRMILDIADADVKPVTIMLKNSDHSHELVLTKFATIRAVTPDNSLILQYKLHDNTITKLGKTMTEKELPKSLEDVVPKCIDGILSMSISSITTDGICSSWIRGVVEYYGGLEKTRADRPYTRFFIRDSTDIIQCIVYEPICLPLIHVLKENMIIETKNYNVAPVKSWSKLCLHKFYLYMGPSTTIRIFSDDDTIVYERSPS